MKDIEINHDLSDSEFYDVITELHKSITQAKVRTFKNKAIATQQKKIISNFNLLSQLKKVLIK